MGKEGVASFRWVDGQLQRVDINVNDLSLAYVFHRANFDALNDEAKSRYIYTEKGQGLVYLYYLQKPGGN